MPQLVCYFQKKITETFSYHWKNCFVSAQTWTRPAADSGCYGPLRTEVLIAHSLSVETVSVEPCYRKFTGVLFQHWRNDKMLLLSTWTTAAFSDGHVAMITGVEDCIKPNNVVIETTGIGFPLAILAHTASPWPPWISN